MLKIHVTLIIIMSIFFIPDVVSVCELSSDEEDSESSDDELIQRKPGRPRPNAEGFAEHQKQIRQAAKEERLARKESEELKLAERKEKEELKLAERMRKAEMRCEIKKESVDEERMRKPYRRRSTEYEIGWNSDDESGQPGTSKFSRTFEERLQ